jgi:starch phosphorylase
MAHLAIVGSAHVNGVSELHSRILRERLFRDFAEMTPAKFGNQTNGVTPRRWLRSCNPALSEILSSRIGDGWVTDLAQLSRVAPLADEPAARAELRGAKRANKERLAAFVRAQLGVSLSPDALFDVQAKRIHEYKRQLLPILHAVHLHQLALRGERRVPRVVLLAGKAAPAYDMAKRIIRLANDVGSVLKSDDRTRDRIELVFLPNYSVSLAELVMPAADLSEQVSTAGTEASGTGNMKLSLNGALTIGTLDGANIEIREAVGAENFFAFGATIEEAAKLRADGYDPWRYYHGDPEIRAALDLIASGHFSPSAPDLFRPVVDALTSGGDSYLVLADFASYLRSQERVEAEYADVEPWTRRAILNTAGMASFSSDHAVRRYAELVWNTGLGGRANEVAAD